MAGLTKEIFEGLSAPFLEEEVEWKAQAISKDKTKALVVPYISARAVMDRLDEVVGPENWSFDFELLPDGTVKGKLTVFGVTKCDRGAIEGEAPTATKGSTSDALKRAAVLFGIGRYLYSLPSVWVKYDPDRHRLLETPSIPKKFLPPEEGGDDTAISLDALLEQMGHTENPLALKGWLKGVKGQIEKLPQEAKNILRGAYEVRMEEFRNAFLERIDRITNAFEGRNWEKKHRAEIEALPQGLQKAVWGAFSKKMKELERGRDDAKT